MGKIKCVDPIDCEYANGVPATIFPMLDWGPAAIVFRPPSITPSMPVFLIISLIDESFLFYIFLYLDLIIFYYPKLLI